MFGVKLQKFSSPVNPEAYERKVFPFQKRNYSRLKNGNLTFVKLVNCKRFLYLSTTDFM